MSKPYPEDVVYKLKGAARAAAIELIVREHEIIKEQPMARSGRAISARDRNILRREVMDELKKQKPELIDILGMDQPAIRINKREDGYPRAYACFPFVTVTVNDGEIDDVFMVCPVDYRGEHYRPESGKKVSKKDIATTDSGETVYKRQQTFSQPHLSGNERGTDIPVNFNPEEHYVQMQGHEDEHIKVFIAGDSSLTCVREYLQRKQGIEDAKRKIEQNLQSIVPQIDKNRLLGAEDGDRLETICCFSADENGKQEVWIKIDNQDKNNSDSIHQGSNAVAVKDNDVFITDGYSNGSFRIKPNRETVEGQKLGRLFDRLSTEPDLGQYWQLWNPTAPKDIRNQFASQSKEGLKAPELCTIRGVHYLVYEIDPALKDNCNPPGSIPVNTAEFLWLLDDIADEERCIKPAEPPEQLSHMRPLRPAP